MSNFYYEYLKEQFSNPINLTPKNYMIHTNGLLKRKHKLYKGIKNSNYICKHCGNSFNLIKTLLIFYCIVW